MDVQYAFHNALEKRKEEKAKIEIACFYKLLPMVRSCVVPKESATMRRELNYLIRANHIVSRLYLRRFRSSTNILKDMAKFSKPEGKGYQDILRKIRRLIAAVGSRGIGSGRVLLSCPIS
jgi:hypothetical protein